MEGVCAKALSRSVLPAFDVGVYASVSCAEMRELEEDFVAELDWMRGQDGEGDGEGEAGDHEGAPAALQAVSSLLLAHAAGTLRDCEDGCACAGGCDSTCGGGYDGCCCRGCWHFCSLHECLEEEDSAMRDADTARMMRLQMRWHHGM